MLRIHGRAAMRGAVFAACGCVLGFADSAMSAPSDDAALKRKAHEVYERGTKASDAGHYEEAAQAFAEADALLPNRVALEAALDVCLLADDPLLCESLLDRAEHDPAHASDPVPADKLKKVHDKYDSRVGKIEIRCKAVCVAKVDGAVTEERSIRVKTGPHHVSLQEGEDSVERDVDVETASVTVEVDRDSGSKAAGSKKGPADDASPPPSTRLISPVFAYVGIGVTLALGGGLIASVVDANAKFDDFTATPPNSVAAHQAEDATKAADLRSNVLIGVTAGAAAVTLTLGLLAIPWGSKKKAAGPSAVHLELSPTGAFVTGAF